MQPSLGCFAKFSVVVVVVDVFRNYSRSSPMKTNSRTTSVVVVLEYANGALIPMSRS